MPSLDVWFRSLQERERRILIAGAVIAAVVLLLALLSLDRSVARAQAHLNRREQDLAWMRSVAPQLAAAGPAAASQATSQRSLIVIVDAAAREVGLATSLSSSEPSGSNGLSVRLEKAPFDTLVGWLARLSEQQGIRVQSATIESGGAPGIVNAGIVLQTSH